MTRKVNLLIVEDSPTQAELLKLLLEEHGYAVRVARHGKQGLSMARELKPTIIISDVMMPEMDGYTLCRAIKHDPALKTIPVILVTTLSSPHDVFKGLECGADNFITKPYDEKYLLARLNYLLTNQELRERGKLQMGLEIDLNGQRHFITAERQQILDLLISTYGEAVHLNEQLAVKQKDLERSYQTLNALYQVAEGLVHCTVEQEIADQVLEKAMALPGVRAGWIFLREPSVGFRTVATHGLPPQLQAPEFLEFGPCACQRMLIEGELDKAANVFECERIRVAGGELEGLKYHASVPLRASGRAIGILNLVGQDQGLFTDDELKILYTLGHQVGIALERAQLFAQLEQRVEERTAALRESQERFALAVEGANTGIWDWDLRTDNVYFSPRWKGMLGYEDHEIAHNFQEWETRLHPDDRERVLKAVQDYLEGRTDHLELEQRLRHKDGSYRWILGRGVSIRDANGRPYRLAGSNDDMTERKQLEEQFRQAQKMEAVGRLAGGIAHDFNNMLTVITGYSELMLAQLPPGAPLNKEAGEIKKAGRRAAELTRQLLAFSRQQVLEPKVLELPSLVTNMDGMLRRLLGEDISLVTVVDPDLGRVKADPGQLEQVIMNLAVNARDAMPQGGRLTVELHNADLDETYTRTHAGTQPGRYVLMAVSDTGCGMDARTKARVFEPFFTTKEKGKGTGLGLSTVYGIIRQSGGFVNLYSELGQGTSFKMYLPRVDEAVSPTETAASSPEQLHGTETVLLVEDEEDVRNLARTILESFRYTVLEATDVDEAIRFGEDASRTIHLLLTDVVMPKMSGRQLAERLTVTRPNLKVLFMSGYTGDAIVRHGVIKAGTAFLQKPFTPMALARKAREVLNGTA